MEERLLSDRNIWDRNWDKEGINPSNLVRELALPDSLAWDRITSVLKSNFGSMNNRRVIEIGSGIGRASARFAREGADITVVDFSPVAIQKAEDFFKASGFKADFIPCDIFHLPEKFRNYFDISISLGLVEHFEAIKREKVFSIHAEVLKKGGVAVIGTPNAYGFPYFIWMYMAKLLNAWEVGYEKPYTHKEIKSIIVKLGYKYKRWGTPFSETVNTYIINKMNIILTNIMFLKRLRAGKSRKMTQKFLPYLKDRWSILDDIFGYHIVFLYK